uniref:NADH dehydrogenase [ubiquinone] 1 beta subcomplex subunit 11, mitochondrial n=1 Tax=Salarias fasciatus TaxID=181472 RepID=A0A672JLU8_SALFA
MQILSVVISEENKQVWDHRKGGLTDKLNLYRTFRDLPGPSRTFQDLPGPSGTFQDLPRANSRWRYADKEEKRRERRSCFRFRDNSLLPAPVREPNPDYHGFSSDPVEDTLNMRVGTFIHYLPDLREREGLPLISENYYDTEKIVLPSSGE